MVDWICYTDGSVRKIPGDGAGVLHRFIGAWAYVMLNPRTHEVIERAEAVYDTTISRMELTAAIEAIRKVDKQASIKVISDSQYVVNSATQWMQKWKRNGWTKDGIEPVKHLDLFKQLDELLQRNRVQFAWVRGHNGDLGNEHADKLANQASSAMKAGRPHYHYLERLLD